MAASASSSSQSPTLDALWHNTTPTALTCCVCDRGIEASTQPLVRTFALESYIMNNFSRTTLPTPPPRPPPPPSHKITVPEQNDTLLLYDRHATCLSGVAYVSVSHVWHSTVAAVQYRRGEQTDGAVEEARRLAYALPMGVYRGLAAAHKNDSTSLELWHDYISVPQWADEAKRKILTQIPRIYAGAAYTLVHLDDVDSAALALMRRGATTRERLTGIVRVCNAAWFSRMWTAMELVQSPRQRVMLRDGVIEDAGHTVFLGEMDRAFLREVREQGDGGKIGAIVNSIGAGGRNLEPWMLGQLCQVHHDLKVRGTTEFAQAFVLLSRRRLTQARDFFYALLGMVAADIEAEKLRNDPQTACLQIAMSCVSRGDYSPLLMIPASVRESGHPQIEHGFNDVNTWGLDRPVLPASIKNGITVRGNKVLLKCVEIGTVHFLRRFRYGELAARDPSDILGFSYIARLALDFTGPDIEAFVETVGGRIYGQNPQAIFDRLARKDRYQHLKHLLTLRYNIPLEDPWGAPNACWIADAMGLSTTELGGNPELTPLKWSYHHGGTMHMGASGAIVGIACPACHGRFLFRVAPYKLLSETLGAVAYRIPGLKYAQTRSDGIAILVKDGHIVGRMIYATPACACQEGREVELELQKLPVPAPNEYKYGGS